jgi:hypothetical protein
MQSDLRVEAAPGDDGSGRAVAPEPSPAREAEPAGHPKQRNPFEEIELPSWVGRER